MFNLLCHLLSRAASFFLAAERGQSPGCFRCAQRFLGCRAEKCSLSRCLRELRQGEDLILGPSSRTAVPLVTGGTVTGSFTRWDLPRDSVTWSRPGLEMKLQEFPVEERPEHNILTLVNVTRRECEIVSVAGGAPWSRFWVNREVRCRPTRGPGHAALLSRP